MVKMKMLSKLLLILLLLISTSAHAIMRGSFESDTYSDITFFWRCDTDDSGGEIDFSATNGTSDYSVADDVGTISSSLVADASAKYSGTLGLDVPTAYDRITFTNGATPIISATGGVGFWLNVQSTPTADSEIFKYYDGDEWIRIRFLSGDVNEIQGNIYSDSTNRNVATSTLNMTQDGSTWYFVVYMWDFGSDIHGIYVYNTSGTLLDSDVDSEELGSIDFASDDTIIIGDAAGIASDKWIDLVIITNDYARSLKDMRTFTTWGSGSPN